MVVLRPGYLFYRGPRTLVEFTVANITMHEGQLGFYKASRMLKPRAAGREAQTLLANCSRTFSSLRLAINYAASFFLNNSSIVLERIGDLETPRVQQYRHFFAKTGFEFLDCVMFEVKAFQFRNPLLEFREFFPKKDLTGKGICSCCLKGASRPATKSPR